MRLQKFKVGDLVEMTSPVEYSLPDKDIGIVLQVIEPVPNQAIYVGMCTGQKIWVTGYRLRKIG